MSGATFEPSSYRIGLYVELESEAGNVLIPYKTVMQMAESLKKKQKELTIDDLTQPPDPGSTKPKLVT